MVKWLSVTALFFLMQMTNVVFAQDTTGNFLPSLIPLQTQAGKAFGATTIDGKLNEQSWQITYTQKDKEVRGIITDNGNKPLQSVSVSLLHLPDSTAVGTTQTDIAGRYLFSQVEEGNYCIKATIVNYQPQYSKSFHISQESVSVPSLQLVALVNNLERIAVTTQKKIVQADQTKLVYNISQSAAASGSTALDVLQRMPGVSINGEENILLKGSANVNVMMDGKMTYLTAEQLTTLLRSTPAENIERVEVITIPSSQYDAAGNAGVINIITKKNKAQGYALNLSAGAGSGRYGQTAENVTGNVRNHWINVFGGYSYSYKKDYLHRTSYRTVVDDGITVNYDRQSFDPTVANNRSYKGGVDLYLGKDNELGFVYSGYNNRWSRDAAGPTYLRDDFNKIDSVVQNHNITIEPSHSHTFNLHHAAKLDTMGKMIRTDADYAEYRNDSYGSLGNGLFATSGEALQPYQLLSFQQPNTITIRSLKTDIALPFKNFKLLTGAKYAYVKADNNSTYDSLINDEYVYSPTLSNHFIYTEKVWAVYVSASKEWKQFSADAGVRLENTHSEGNSITTSLDTKRSYTNLFPYLSLSKTIDKNNSIGIAVTRRINRPQYENLNPFRYFFDKYSYHEGNPYLQPELSWKTAFTYTLREKYIATISYERTSHPILGYIQQDSSSGTLIVGVYNFFHRDNYDAQFIVPITISKWWSAENTIDIYYQSYLLSQTKNPFTAHKLVGDFSSTHTFSLPYKISAEVNVYYTTPSLDGAYILKRYFTVDGGVKKSFLKNKLTAKLSVTDWFNTIHYWGYSTSPASNVHYNHTGDFRRININLLYHFGGKLSAGKEHVLEEEKRL